jgi:hypothetical protein
MANAGALIVGFLLLITGGLIGGGVINVFGGTPLIVTNPCQIPPVLGVTLTSTSSTYGPGQTAVASGFSEGSCNLATEPLYYWLTLASGSGPLSASSTIIQQGNVFSFSFVTPQLAIGQSSATYKLTVSLCPDTEKCDSTDTILFYVASGTVTNQFPISLLFENAQFTVVPNVIAQLYTNVGGAPASFIGQKTSDVDGIATFQGVSAGAYIVEYYPPGFSYPQTYNFQVSSSGQTITVNVPTLTEISTTTTTTITSGITTCIETIVDINGAITTTYNCSSPGSTTTYTQTTGSTSTTTSTTSSSATSAQIGTVENGIAGGVIAVFGVVFLAVGLARKPV